MSSHSDYPLSSQGGTFLFLGAYTALITRPTTFLFLIGDTFFHFWRAQAL
jgi:hypothetical protein